MTFQHDLNRFLADANARLAEALGPDAPPVHVEVDTTPLLSVKQHAAYLPVSLELAVDMELITEEEARAQGWTPPPPPSRRDRLRWRWQAWRERMGRRVGGWLAGVDLTERDEDW